MNLCVKCTVAEWKWYVCAAFPLESSNAARVSPSTCSTHLVSTPQRERVLPNMLTRSAMPQGWLGNTITHTHTHLNAPPGCGIQFNSDAVMDLAGLALFILLWSSRISLTLTHVFIRLWVMTMKFWSLTTVDTTLCYLDAVTASSRSFSNPIILRQISFWEPLPSKGC